MSVLFARAVVVPVWMILFALIALLAPPFGATTGLLQLLGLALAVSALLAFMVSAVLGPVPHAGARCWHVRGVPAAIQLRTRAASDVRTMVPSDLGNRSPGQASRGLGLRDGLRGRARGRSPML
jgi:hypothetical protein